MEWGHKMKPGASSTRTRAFVETFILCVGVIALILLSIVPSMAGLKEDLEAVAEKHDSASVEINRNMHVNNPDLELSMNTKIMDDVAYVKIAGGLSRWNAEDIFQDFAILNERGVKEIHIYLNSPGGDAAQGLCLTDELRIFREANPDIPLIIHARGLIASAAIPVLVQGTKRICSASTIFLIHPATLTKWGLFTEDLKDLESQTRLIKILRDSYAEMVAGRTNLDKERLIEMMGEDTWFTTAEALEWGFVDEVE